ncbi:hypothetical protein KAW50_08900 [candidate division WOR-3 bacterium]|nr:hypothetical protein [candidate division WOR-3 bacterium]
MKRLLLIIFMLFGLFPWTLAAQGEKINVEVIWHATDEIVSDKIDEIIRLEHVLTNAGAVALLLVKGERFANSL